MAKAEKPEISKKQAVVNFLTEHPDATTSEVVAGVKKQGIDISPESVHTIKWALKKSNWPAASKAAKKEATKAEPSRGRGRYAQQDAGSKELSGCES